MDIEGNSKESSDEYDSGLEEGGKNERLEVGTRRTVDVFPFVWTDGKSPPDVMGM